MKLQIGLFSRFLFILELCIWVLAILFMVTIMASLFYPDAFYTLIIQEGFRPEYNVGLFRYCSSCTDDSLLRLSDLNIGMKIWLLTRGILIMGLTYVIIRKLRAICKFTTAKSTFYEGSIRYFRQIASYGFALAVLSSFNFYINGEASNVFFSIPFMPLGFSLFCLMLAEVFKEGKMLTEDKNSII